ncbi:MAG: RNA 2',3'-cyclic phosphodiesterase [Deltaproteobacteria bacterium]|nr:RNA 2',3'-cyclic phosphodiesterase [Deltaproteobacteria bacterium]
MPRLFVALSLPEPIRIRLAADRPLLEKARFESPDKLHVTLRFIGDLPDDALAPLEQALERVTLDPFELELAGAGSFPPRGPPRVLWAGINKCPTLDALAGAVEAACVSAGVPEEPRPFHAHVTLARLHPDPRNKRLIESALATLSKRPPETFAVDSFELVESTLGRSGSTYRARRSFPLGLTD